MTLKIIRVLIFIKPTEAVGVFGVTKLPKRAARKAPWESRGSLQGTQVQEKPLVSRV